MLKHSLLIIFRNFKRFKISFFINLIGLSVGLASTLLIYIWIKEELNTDSYNQKNNQLYQVMRNEPISNGIQTEEYTPGPLAKALAQEMPQIEYAVAVVPPNSVYQGVISAEDSHIKATPQFADKEYFDVFTINFTQGEKRKVLLDKNAISISSELASKLFHTSENVVGKTVKFENEYFNGVYVVAGVFDLPSETSNKFDILLNYDLFLEKRPEVKDWSNGGPSTFLILKEGTDINSFNNQIAGFLKTKRTNTKETLFVQKYSDRYLYGKYENGKPTDGRITYLRLFSIIGVFILVIACINFMNLSTAQASRRIKEVGVKKTLGVSRRALIIQFLSESLLMVFISLIISVILVVLLLPQFNEIIGKQLSINFDVNFTVSILGIALITGLIAGSYPAFYISNFNPVTVLKGKLITSLSEIIIRKGLVIFQFTISAILIVAVLVVYQQIKFIQNKNLGYNKDNVISFSKEGKLESNFQTFLSQARNIPGVLNASYMFGNLTGGSSSRSGGLSWEGQNLDEAKTEFNYLDVDYNLIETLDIKMKEGRPFSREFGADSSAIIFNEAAIKAMGLKNPIGKTVNFYGKRQIIGVVKDFYFESLFQKVKPFFFKIDYETGGDLLIRIKAGTEKSTIDQIEKLYKTYNEGFPFEYGFLDDAYQAQYVSENRIAILSRYFAGIAVMISSMGLFGLAAFMAQRRLKEIGIRKILGASEFGIIYLLSNEFTKIIIISLAISFPISYIVSKNWLDSFAYKISLEWWYFAGAGLTVLVMAWIAVGVQILKVAKVNPSQCLREE